MPTAQKQDRLAAEGAAPPPATIDSASTAADRAAEGALGDVPAEQVGADERIAALEQMMGDDMVGPQRFAEAVREHCRQGWDRFVAPLLAEHWPEAVGGPDDEKLKYLACHLYAPAPYTVLFCSRKSHWTVKLATTMGTVLRLDSAGLDRGAKTALSVFKSLFPTLEQQRIVSIAAFIATIDHAFDHYMHDHEPLERERRIKGLLDGSWAPDHGALKLTRALQEQMSAGISSQDDRDVYEAALARVVEWVESEVLGMTGVEDPRGLGWRLAGVEGTIDGLIFPVHRAAGDGARQWMYDVSLFTQMMDDWIDYDDDRKDIRTTPVISGAWTFGVIRDKWLDTVRGVEELAREGGMASEAYQAFVRDAYVHMMRDVMRAMAHGIAA